MLLPKGEFHSLHSDSVFENPHEFFDKGMLRIFLMFLQGGGKRSQVFLIKDLNANFFSKLRIIKINNNNNIWLNHMVDSS